MISPVQDAGTAGVALFSNASDTEMDDLGGAPTVNGWRWPGPPRSWPGAGVGGPGVVALRQERHPRP